MSSSEGDVAKARGNTLFAAGQYKEAIDAFTEAITINPQEAVYYSNRSGAYLKLQMYQKAVQDGLKCVELRPKWGKSYSRLGAAYFYQKKYQLARQTYQAGLDRSPQDETLKQGLASVNATHESIAKLVWSTTHAKQRFLQFLLRSLLMLLFVSYWIPMGASTGAWIFSTFFKIACVLYATALFFNHGKPQMNQPYLQKLVLDPNMSWLMFALLFWMQSPYTIALIPVALYEGVQFCSYLGSLFIALESNLGDFGWKLADKVMPYYTGNTNWISLSNQQKWSAIYYRTPVLCANFDVAIGFCLLLEVFTPARNIILLFVYWQLLRIRCMISPQLKASFRNVDTVLSSFVYHPRCPAIVGNLYGKLRTTMQKMVEIPSITPEQQAAQAQQGSAAGLMSKCNIM